MSCRKVRDGGGRAEGDTEAKRRSCGDTEGGGGEKSRPEESFLNLRDWW